MLGQSQLALATQAGRMVVDAAAAEQWLGETREQLTGQATGDTRLLRTALAVRWAGRLADLLKQDPDAEAVLKALVQDIQAAPPAGGPSGPNHGVSANGVVSTQPAGLELPGALATRSELAYSAGLAGDAAGARDQFAELLPVATRVLGPEHPDTLATRASLAYWTGQAGNAAGARDQFAAL